MKLVQLAYVYLLPESAPVQQIVLYGETAQAVQHQFEQAGLGVWRVVYAQELGTYISPHCEILTMDQAAEWLGCSADKIHRRAGDMDLPMIKDGTLMFSRRHLEGWRDRRFKKFALFEAA